MKARLLKNQEESYVILYMDGTIAEANKHNLTQLLQDFRVLKGFQGNDRKWNDEYPDMNAYPGDTYAYITDNDQLVICDFAPFEVVMEVETLEHNLVTVTEYGKIHKKSVEQIKLLCRHGRIAGAEKIGRDWMIPADAPYPKDRRYSKTK